MFRYEEMLQVNIQVIQTKYKDAFWLGVSADRYINLPFCLREHASSSFEEYHQDFCPQYGPFFSGKQLKWKHLVSCLSCKKKQQQHMKQRWPNGKKDDVYVNII